MKIAYLGIKGLPSKSGTERVVEAIVSRLNVNHEITVYCDADYTPPGTQFKGVRLIRIPTLRGKHIKPILLDLFSAFHALIFGRYDVIHMNGVENCFTLPLLKLRYRIVSTAHGTPGRMPLSKWSKMEKFLMQMMEYPFVYLSDSFTTVSSTDNDYYHSKYKKEIIYVPNGVDCDLQINRQAALRHLDNLGLAPHSFLLFIAGRIIERKGCHLLLESINKLNMDVPLVVIGDLEQVPIYSQKLKELAGNRPVIFEPPITDKGLLLGILDLCKLFIFPSTAEGMSIMLLEAASQGVPMICSDIPENKIVLDELVTYFRSEDTDDLAEKIRWAMENIEEQIHLGEKLINWVKVNYSWDSIALKYELIYRKYETQ
jgi:glycosyltransferase involved in cell wall biosynthesis